LSTAGYAPDFVRSSALQGWALPPDVKIEATGQILSALRRVAAGEPVAVLLDQTQAAALATLPFAADIKTVMQSPQLPVALIVVVDSRVPPARARALQTALLKMGSGIGRRRRIGGLAPARLRAGEVARPRAHAVTKRLCWGLLMATVGGCAGQPRPAPPAPPSAQPTSVSALAAAIDADSKRSDHETDSKARADIAADASRDADSCLALEPQAVACLYGRGVAYRAAGARAPGARRRVPEQHAGCTGACRCSGPQLRRGGARRACGHWCCCGRPGWPLGPGDADAALVAARRAVALKPEYPANLLALAEALAKTGDGSGARDAYSRARDAAMAMPASEDRDGWLRESDQGLAKAR
jgi:hypothetical protein